VLDPAIAAQYGLSYNGPAACEPASVAAAGPPFVPAATYFTAVGLEQSYGKPSQTTPDFGALVTNTGITLGEAFGIATAAGGFLAGVGGGLTGGFFSEIFPFATYAGDWVLASTAGEVAETAPAVTEGFAGAMEAAGVGLEAGGIGFSIVLGPVAIIEVCEVVAGVAAYEVYENQQNLNQLNNLPNLLAQAENTPPDLNTFVTDTTRLGLTKLTETLVAETLPDVSSTAPLPAHGPSDPVFLITSGSGGSGAVESSFTYADWNGIAWQATTSGGWFDLTCQGDSSGKNCPQADSFNASIHFVDWSGKNRIAARLSNNFTIIDPSPSSTEKPCPADPNTGLSTSADLSTCSSYVASQIQYMYQGNQYTLTLSHLPVFTSSTTIYFTQQGQQQTAAVTAQGLPSPAISLVSGSLPAGITLLPSSAQGNGNAAFQYAGNQAAQQGTYQVTLQAQNAYGTTTQAFTIVIAQQLQITSPSALTANYGQPVSFLVTTTGVLPMTLSIAPGLLPSGLSFHDNQNGTATISGTPTEVNGNTTGCITYTGQPPCTPPGITATNGQGTVTQPFNAYVNPPPQPVLTINTATFVAGASNSFTVTTTGATTPVEFVFVPNGLGMDPSWLSFHDNGDGTGVLTGTPPEGTSGSVMFYLYAIANVPGSGAFQNNNNFNPTFTINVNNQPTFLTPTTATFTVGDPGSFTITTNQTSGTITDSGALPNDIEFTDNGNGTATISGTPAAGAGGVTTLQLSIVGNTGTGTQALNIQVNEKVAFTSAPYANFYVGQENSFAVQVSGYPLLSSAPVAQSQTAANYVPGVQFAVEGVPGDLSYSNLNPEGYNTGTLTISGNPSSADLGQHTVFIGADNTIDSYNGSGPATSQTLTLNIAMPGDVNGDGVVNCTDFDLVKASFGTYRGQPGYNPAADLNNDGVINIEDLAIVSRHLPEGTVCH
jgi:hypothetical protein